jgi:hypothetical protein
VSKNKHLEHVEDLILLEGTNGAQKAIQVLRDVGKALTPSGGAGITITTKWDGAPAVVCGIDPADGKFFVGSKSVFNAQNPKVAKSQSDVQRMYDGGLAAKLSDCYRYLRPVVTSGVLQGDLLFTNDKSTKQIDGKRMVTFRANTITYAAEADSDIGREISSANLGIVFHTRYDGPTLPEMSASFGVSDGEFNKVSNVYAVSATFKDVSGAASFNPDEYQAYMAAINMAEGSAKQAGSLLNDIYTGGKALQIDTEFKKYFNSYFKVGNTMPNVNAVYNGFFQFLGNSYNTAINKNTTLKAQADKAFKWLEAVDYVDANQQKFRMLIATYMNLIRAKNIAVAKMNQIQSIGTFVETSDGFKVTSPEGFVAITGRSAVKLIDRLEFSNLNFNVEKTW